MTVEKFIDIIHTHPRFEGNELSLNHAIQFFQQVNFIDYMENKKYWFHINVDIDGVVMFEWLGDVKDWNLEIRFYELGNIVALGLGGMGDELFKKEFNVKDDMKKIWNWFIEVAE